MCVSQASPAAGATPQKAIGRPGRSVRILAAYLDAVGGYRTEGSLTAAHCELQSLRVESHVVINNDGLQKNLGGQVR